MRRTWISAMIVVVVGLAVPAAAHAQTPYGSGALTLSATTLTAGQAVTVSGTGFSPTSSVTLTFTSDPVVLANITTNSSGAFSVGVNVPSNATVGTHTLTAAGTAADNSAARILAASLNVVASGTTPLVRTGSSHVGTLLLWGTLLIVLGSVAVLAVRRNQFRRQRSSWS